MISRAASLVSIAVSIVLGFGVLPTGAVAQATEDSLPPGVTMDMVAEGEKIFHDQGMCVNCHGDDAHGLIGPDLTDSDWLQAKGSYLSILRVVLSGVSEELSSTGTEMPPRGGTNISDGDVQAVAAYVWALSHPEERHDLPAGVTEAMIASGQEVFQDRGDCASCHGADATGDDGPNLTDAAWLHAKGSYMEILSTILNGVPAEKSTRGIQMPPKGGSAITNREVQAVAAYVWYISHSGRE